jgi:hypothetical protein
MSGRHFPGSQARHDAGAAGDIQYFLACAKLRSIDKIVPPLRGNPRHEVALVKLCRITFQLPMTVTHRAPPF